MACVIRHYYVGLEFYMERVHQIWGTKEEDLGEHLWREVLCEFQMERTIRSPSKAKAQVDPREVESSPKEPKAWGLALRVNAKLWPFSFRKRGTNPGLCLQENPGVLTTKEPACSQPEGCKLPPPAASIPLVHKTTKQPSIFSEGKVLPWALRNRQ